MCEPSHSIVQFPYDDLPPSAPLPTGISTILGKIGRGLKNIKGLLHISKMGHGHSETLGAADTPSALVRLNNRIYWEGHWWNRTVHEDFGTYLSEEMRYIKPVAIEAAKEYANRVSIGSMSVFRRFFEASLLVTNNPSQYFEAFRRMLNAAGIREFERKLAAGGLKIDRYGGIPHQQKKKSIMAICLGLTRKRPLLVPEWSDDKELWSPNKQVLTIDLNH